ncbi:hypothetical protein [Ktedonobacter robiniae]|uniref:DUF4253 domain-containing protein n=1 Tax=Ktedonobacter robiniae TaxID=2778365 RepID=A0ABQ3V2Y8_9CHLR|nr:hypothetical protein [Ktedonobacter robiniae]GHO59283.1 hypothetical protein KSB_77580 [Ktedonobacter robiniae]
MGTEERQSEGINTIQGLHLELLRHVQYNSLDGERVVSDLLEWCDLWYSVLPVRMPFCPFKPDDGHYHPYSELGMLRHARWNSWIGDTLYIWTNDNSLPLLRQRIEERWEPSEIGVFSSEADAEMQLEAFHDKHDRVLFLWWD